MSELKKFLIKTKELIDTPDKWMKGAYLGRNSDGNECRCLKGALIAVEVPNILIYDSYLNKIKQSIADYTKSDMEIVTFNDLETTTHQDIMNVLDHAIATAD